MAITFTNHNTEASEALKNYATEKLKRLQKLATNITSIHVVFDVDKLRHKAEATIRMPRAEFHASSESENMYKTIDSLVDKLSRQLSKHKEKLTDHS